MASAAPTGSKVKSPFTSETRPSLWGPCFSSCGVRTKKKKKKKKRYATEVVAPVTTRLTDESLLLFATQTRQSRFKSAAAVTQGKKKRPKDMNLGLLQWEMLCF